ncbi:MAG: signal peptidase I [Candidatus Zambryskibacteria bacterium]|nr:signal peptidase I [Candidatus Zambryskibacteria bacterium]
MDPLQTPEVLKEKPIRGFSFLKELVTFAIIAVCIIYPFRKFVAEPYIVSGASMSPTFETGHYLIIDKISYRLNPPKRYDVIVMKYPADTSRDFIKRVIGLPGETVEIDNGIVTIINTEHPEGFTLDQSFITLKSTDTLTRRLSANEYFVMGDNRAGSFDSRGWGALPSEDIIGKTLLRLYPFNQIGLFPGSHTQ